jgi:putative protein kinase ArgK-like GTPase of G3E family
LDNAAAQEAAALEEDVRAVGKVARMAFARLGDDTSADAEAGCKRLLERLELGVDHTIVALLGGSGSGKSSLFNALAQMDFSPVGVVRPTTAAAKACVWGRGADQLLAWLGVSREHSIQRDSVLEDHIRALRGLILLDTPDFDSAAEDNRAVVERVLPQADLIIWVTDPQKYADPLLHQRYLRAMGGLRSSMLVVLNQVDTLPAADAARVIADLKRLLVKDGLENPSVLGTSAATGLNVARLRALLIDSTTRRTTAARRAANEMLDIADLLEESLGDPGETAQTKPAPPEWVHAAHADARKGLFERCGGQALAKALAARRPADRSALHVPEKDSIRSVLVTWLERALDELPPIWGGAAGHALASPPNIAARLAEALEAVDIPPAPPWWRRFILPRLAARERASAFEAGFNRELDTVIKRTMTEPTVAVLEDWTEAHRLLSRVLASEV